MFTYEYSVSQLKNIVHEIVNSKTYPVFFHCTAGKDRTGIVAMLLLYILDVSEEKIMENYLEINKKHKSKGDLFYYLIRILMFNKELAVRAREYYIVDKAYLNTAIQAIKEKYGSMENYITNVLGVTKEMKEEFKNKVLE